MGGPTDVLFTNFFVTVGALYFLVSSSKLEFNFTFKGILAPKIGWNFSRGFKVAEDVFLLMKFLETEVLLFTTCRDG